MDKELYKTIKNLLDDSYHFKHRYLFFIYGKDAKQMVIPCFNLLSNHINNPKPSVLWCHKDWKEDKKMFNLNNEFKLKNQAIPYHILKNLNPLEKFAVTENVCVCHYQDVYKFLGNSYDMIVLQDFKALTPNYLAQTIEMANGGGIILILVPQISSLEKFLTLEMNIHSKYKTNSHPCIYPMFNKRFLLSLGSCKKCIILSSDGKLHPSFNHIRSFKSQIKYKKTTLHQSKEHFEKVESNNDIQKVLVNFCKTDDQAHALRRLLYSIESKSEKTLTLIAARGRGKSAALGLAVAYAIKMNLSNITVTAPSVHNLKSFFNFVIIGLNKYGYGTDYSFEYTCDQKQAISCISISKSGKNQIILFKYPFDIINSDFCQDLLIIDEAAAIPLSIVKNIIGKCLTFMASTICGYEGTGRSLSLKLIQELREKTANLSEKFRLEELNLHQSIRYGDDDDVEKWLYQLLCLETKLEPINIAQPEDCHLFYLNKNSLFNFHPNSEKFLHQVISLYAAAHYRNSPNDLHMLMDAPMHHLFCLLPKANPDPTDPPPPLCVLHVSFEGKVFVKNVRLGLRHSRRLDGDLIPWIITEHYDRDLCKFSKYSGLRIVRIATHPNYQRMGYGRRALHLLESYFSNTFEFVPKSQVLNTESLNVNESLKPVYAGPLFYKLSERPVEDLDYLGVSFGLSKGLLRFWRKLGFIPFYLRDVPNKVTCEHTCIMLKPFEKSKRAKNFIDIKFNLFENKFFNLFSKPSFKQFPIKLAYSLIRAFHKTPKRSLNREIILENLSETELEALRSYHKIKTDTLLINHVLPKISRMYFSFNSNISFTKQMRRIALGLLYRDIEDIAFALNVERDLIQEVINNLLLNIFVLIKGNYVIKEKDDDGCILKKQRL